VTPAMRRVLKVVADEGTFSAFDSPVHDLLSHLSWEEASLWARNCLDLDELA